MSQEKSTALGVTENLEALLCYVLGWLTGAAFLFIEKENRFVRFHAMQSLVTFLALAIVMFILHGPLAYLPVPMLGYFLGFLTSLVGLLNLFLWVFLMVKAWKGEWYRLPVAGDFAAKQLGMD